MCLLTKMMISENLEQLTTSKMDHQKVRWHPIQDGTHKMDFQSQLMQEKSFLIK
jgi:hypothetical protein